MRAGGRLAHLPGEWNHRSKRMEDFTPASHEIVPWKCGKCGWEWNAMISNRTMSDGPRGCPECNPGGRPRKKPIEL
jgi:hypothetical protein